MQLPVSRQPDAVQGGGGDTDFVERLRRDCSLPPVYFDYFLYDAMSTDAEKAAAEKLAQEEAAARMIADELASTSSASAAAIWPNGGYDLLISFIVVSIYTMLIAY